MPLLPGKANVGHNISEMVKSGHPRDQAIAASLKKAGLSNKYDKPGRGKVMRRLEAFSISTKRGEQYTPNDLQEMVDNFKRFSLGQRPCFNVPAVFGHKEKTPEEQERFLEDSSIPAAAWVDHAEHDG